MVVVTRVVLSRTIAGHARLLFVSARGIHAPLTGKSFVRSYKADQVLAMEAPARCIGHFDGKHVGPDHPRPPNLLRVRGATVFPDGAKRLGLLKVDTAKPCRGFLD